MNVTAMPWRAPVLAALAGLVSGVLATVPLLGLALNCLCCASVWGSAAGVVLWEKRRHGISLTPRDGAALGLITGVVSGAVAAAFIIVLTFDPREAAALLREARVESEARAIIERLLRLVESGALTAAIAAFTVVMHTAVGVLGGAAAAAAIK
jgi:hypothetical protein